MSAPLILQLAQRGITLRLDGADLSYRAPAGAMTAEVRALLTEGKAGLISVLADPPKAAREHWKAAVNTVTARWDAVATECRTRGEEPPWLDQDLDDRLQLEVRESILSGDLLRALAAIEDWKQAWLELLDAPAPAIDPRIERGWAEIESDVLGEHVIVALRPDAVREAQLAHPGLLVYGADEVEWLHGIQDPNLIRAVHVAKKLLGGEVQDPKLADAIIEEFDRRRPPPNPTVLQMFSEARARLGTRDIEERSLTAWLRRHAPEVADLWPEAPLDASWYDWRQRVGQEPLHALDRAWCASVGAHVPPWALQPSNTVPPEKGKEPK